MDFGVHKDIQIEHYPLQMDEHKVGYIPQHTPLRKVTSRPTSLTLYITNHLPHMHPFQRLLQRILILNSHRVVVELLFPFSHLFAGVAGHLDDCSALEIGFEEEFVGGVF